jgi:DHA1 family bicyclomycin/chloramphenicol resistance-like MFS transporter
VASALTGLIQSLANSLVAPIASSGGGETAVPMVWVMIVGSATAWLAYLLMARAPVTPEISA